MTTPIGKAHRKSRSWLIGLAVAGSALLASACNHSHLGDNYGVSYNAWFTAQHVRHEPSDSEPTKRALGGLDAQEAASVSKNYRKASGGADSVGQGQLLMNGQPRGGNEPYTPPPSVPGGN